MTISEQLQLANKIAKLAHAGQTDKAGVDYYSGHVSAVIAGSPEGYPKVVAALHDVIEDTDVTLDDLRRYGFDDEVVEAVQLLTHDNREPYMAYVLRVKQNPVAAAVKMSDLRNNMDTSRLPNFTEKDAQRLEKYRKAYALLNSK